MKNIVGLIAFLILLVGCRPEGPSSFYVSPDGDDNNVGSLEAPFQTIEKAKLAVRASNKRDQDITIYLRGGVYPITKTIRFGVEDSAPDGCRYTYKAYEKEVPVLSSGVKVSSWKLLQDYPENFPEEAKGKVWVANYPDNIKDFKVMFAGDRRIDRSKKEGFVIRAMEPIGFEQGKTDIDKDREYISSRSMNVYFDKDRDQLKRFHFDDPDHILRPWDNMNDIELGFAPVPWTMNLIPLDRIDFDHKVGYITMEANSPAGAKKSHTKPWIENAIDYISQGTFVTKSNSRKIYYWPEGGEPEVDVVVPSLLEYILVEGDVDYKGPKDVPVKNLSFEGITFQHGDRFSWTDDHKGWGIQHDWDKFDNANAMLRLRGAESCVVEKCRFTNSGNSAIRLDLYCQKNIIKSNLIDHVGHMGILLCGYGPGTKDVNKNNQIVSNLIHHVGTVWRQGAGIFVWQSGGNKITHNLIHHVPRKGVGLCGVRMPILTKRECKFDEGSKTIRWDEIDADFKRRNVTLATKLSDQWHQFTPYLHARNNVVSFNEVYRALEALGDGSVLNVSGAGEGNVVENNYVHHIASHASGVLRTDDWQRGTTFKKNVIYMANVAAIVHKGFNHVVNNMILDCSTKESIRWASYPDEAADYGSLVQRNIFFDSSEDINFYRVSYRASEGISLPRNTKVDYNLFWCAKKETPVEKHFSKYRPFEVETHSIDADPLFVDYKHGNFNLKKNSPAFKLGFEPIDMSTIGLLADYPAKYMKLGTGDKDRKPIFHRQIANGGQLYDFW
ncbi:right-handed parallel beta-helix repeat-containing protein [Halosquirtibacter xylanolyticus]|uniref:right-handed parallel beta-helix repeat-containing protein n=1 Tax=Halosquirtibacter xylanolyticus TaxID=3374599 RepID=UPI003748E262|nr:right-handed parallel beta-helix repeat-containing protein [Prolixibacteraceae bacterium]